MHKVTDIYGVMISGCGSKQTPRNPSTGFTGGHIHQQNGPQVFNTV